MGEATVEWAMANGVTWLPPPLFPTPHPSSAGLLNLGYTPLWTVTSSPVGTQYMVHVGGVGAQPQGGFLSPLCVFWLSFRDTS